MAVLTVISYFGAGIVQVGHQRNISHGWVIANGECAPLQMAIEDREIVVDPLAQESQYLRIGLRGERTQIAIGRHISRQLVIVPEQPSQYVELLRALAAKSAIPIGKLQEDRGRLRKTHAVFLQHGNLPHLVDSGPPLRSPGTPASKVSPDRLEGLTAQREHQGKLVAISRFGEVVQSVARHRPLPR